MDDTDAKPIKRSDKQPGNDAASAKCLLRSEVNLLIFPCFVLQGKHSGHYRTIEFSTKTERDGKLCEIKWVATPNVQYGIPTDFDRRVLRALEFFWSQLPRPLSMPLPTPRPRHMARLMRLTYSGRFTQRLLDSYERLAGLTLLSEAAVYLKSKKKWLTDVFHIFDRVTLAGKKTLDGIIAETTLIYPSEVYLDNLNAMYVCPLDYDFLMSLNPLQSRITELLTVKFYGRRNGVSYRYSTFCGLLPIQPQKHFSKAVEKLKPHLDNLSRQEVLQYEWTLDPEERNNWLIHFKPGNRTLKWIELVETKKLAGSIVFPNQRPLPTFADYPNPAHLNLASDLPEASDLSSLSSDQATDSPDSSQEDLAALFLKAASQFPEFRVNPDKDRAWFRSRIESNPAYHDLDLEEEILNWADWLESQHRLKEARKSNKFPKSNFRGSFNNWLKKSLARKGVKPAKWESECPQEEILNLYHQICHMCPPVKVWDKPRQELLRARWNEDNERQNLDWWRDYFSIIADSDFLTGRVRNFVADLEWILDPNHMAKILNGRYSTREQTTMTTPDAWHMARVIHEWGRKHIA